MTVKQPTVFVVDDDSGVRSSIRILPPSLSRLPKIGNGSSGTPAQSRRPARSRTAR